MLTDQHLRAEYRELPRLFSHTAKHPNLDNVPEKFCLGAGHVNFFKNKMGFLLVRLGRILNELEDRGFKCNMDYLNPLDAGQVTRVHFAPWTPSAVDIAISKTRIIEKIEMKPHWYKYRGKPLTKELLKYYGIQVQA
jgi:deoxyribonuclease (pyrimidine dimer)